MVNPQKICMGLPHKFRNMVEHECITYAYEAACGLVAGQRIERSVSWQRDPIIERNFSV